MNNVVDVLSIACQLGWPVLLFFAVAGVAAYCEDKH